MQVIPSINLSFWLLNCRSRGWMFALYVLCSRVLESTQHKGSAQMRLQAAAVV